MKQFVVIFRLGGRQSTARVAAWDAKGARGIFRHNHPRAEIIGVKPVAAQRNPNQNQGR